MDITHRLRLLAKGPICRHDTAAEAADLIEQQAAELERLNADRQLQAKLLLAAHKMLMSADLGPSSKDYLDQWAFIRDAELERLRADAEHPIRRHFGWTRDGRGLIEIIEQLQANAERYCYLKARYDVASKHVDPWDEDRPSRQNISIDDYSIDEAIEEDCGIDAARNE